MRMLRLAIIFPLSLLVACGKNSGEGVSLVTGSRDATLKTFDKQIFELNSRIDERNDSVGKGFNSVTGLVVERCLENTGVQFIYDPRAQVSYDENLTSEQIVNKLGIGVNLNIPLEISGIPISLSPEINYAKESSVTTLAKTAHITVNIKKGYNQIIQSNNANIYFIKDEFYNFLKQNSADFFNTCGDEVIVKQFLNAQLLITAKFRFTNEKVKKDFETAIGASLLNPFALFATDNGKPSAELSLDSNAKVEESDNKFSTFLSKVTNTFGKVSTESSGLTPSLKVKLSNMHEETLKNVTLSVKAIQLGGDPSRLPALVSSSCILSDSKSCESIFRVFQQYAAEDFPEQLRDKDSNDKSDKTKTFYAGDTEKVLYSTLPISNKNKQNIGKEIAKYLDSSLNFTQLKLNLRNDIKESFKKYLNAQDLISSNTFLQLAQDEIKLVKETKTIAENNLYGLFRFVNQCYSDTKKCQSEYTNNKAIFYKNFDENFDEIRAWSLLAATTANWQPIRYTIGFFNSDRMTQDFLMTSSFRGYSLFFIKYLDRERNKITSKNYNNISLSTSMRCHSWFSDSLGKLWLHEVQANTVLPVTDSITNACGAKASFAGTFNSDLSKLGQFYFEIWAQ